MENKKWNRKRILKSVGKIFLALLALFVLLVLVLRTPWAQNYIVTQLTDYVSGKTGTKVAIERVFITFAGDLKTKGIYLEDIQGDTLLFAKELQLDLPLYPLLFKNRLSIDDVSADGIIANIHRGSERDRFNFSFIIDAFSTPTDSTQSSEPMEISLGNFSLSDWKVDYEDDYLGTYVHLSLGTLETDMEEFDLETMIFSVVDFELGNTQITYNQAHAFPESDEPNSSPLPKINVDQLLLDNVTYEYSSSPDSIATSGKLNHFNITEANVNLSESIFTVEDFIVEDSSIALTLNQSVDTTQTQNTSFKWPEMELSANNIRLKNNEVHFSRPDAHTNETTFNPNNLNFQEMTFLARDFNYKPKIFELILDETAFKEASGMVLKQLGFNVQVSDKASSLKDLSVSFNQSKARANFEMEYESLEQALVNTSNSNLNASITDVSIATKDVQKFLPQLQHNRYLDSLSQHNITGNLEVFGNVKRIDRFQSEIHWGPNTHLYIQGEASAITDEIEFSYNLNDINLNTINTDVYKLVSDKELGIEISESIALIGNAKGTLKSLETHLQLSIPEGFVHLDGNARFDTTQSFDGTLKTDSLHLGKILKNPQLGLLSLHLNASGSGTNLSNLNSKIDGQIPMVEFHDYAYKDILINGEISNGTGGASLEMQDRNLNFKSTATIDLKAATNSVNFNANLIGADLRALGLTRKDIKLAANMEGSYTGLSNNFSLETTIDNGIAVTDNQQYQIAPLNINAHVEDSITDVKIKSGFINGGLFSNASPARITAALKNQFETYFSSDSLTTMELDSVKATLDLALAPTPIISKVFFDGIQELDSLTIDAKFDSFTKEISGQVIVPRVSYAGSTIDSLRVDLEGDSQDFKFMAGVSELDYQPVLLKKTYLEGSLKNKELVLDFSSVDDSTTVMHVASELVFQRDTVRLHVSPKNLVLNKKPWDIPEDNVILLANSYSQFKNVLLSRNSQKLEVSTQIPEMSSDHIGIQFENFQLQTFLSLFNPEESLAKGIVDGNFVILNPYGASGLVSELNIDQFRLLQNPLGTLSLNASSKSLSDYDIDLLLKDGGANVRLTGDYAATQNGADLNLELDIQKLETAIVQGFYADELSNPSGNISGSLLVNGSLTEPEYSGRIKFNDVGLTLSAFKTDLKINGQQLDLNEEEIALNSFRINDSNQGSLLLDGAITTDNLLNPGFQLTVKAKNFTALNSEKGDNELVYGSAVIDTDLEITGDLELPVIDGSLSIGYATDLTYLVPQTQYEIQEREGVVIFVNRENPDAILTRNTGETASSVFSGMDINTTLEILDDAVFTIVLDEKTQDKLQASGNASLSLNIDPNQDIRLSGRLELNSGFYRTSLYNLVSREFTINEGSSVTWSGDPYNAKLNVTAIYELETSAAPLMSSISFGQDTGISGQYQRSSTFLVYLNVGGEITTPELSFALDMPENAQGSYGGAVYGRIQQLNEQESELNKQVFSLLALNRFYPTSGSDGSNGGAIALARNNVNKVLSSELNTISNKILGNSGFELDFDLDSFQDYQGNGYRNRTQLNVNASKKLFNDRLIVTAGSALDVEGSAANSDTSTPVIGNVMLEYLLSEKGTYRLKGFRRQEYQNIIDGQLIVTGLAFIFDREFNKFSQLFSPVKVKTEDNIEENDNQKKEN
ncbi:MULTISPECIES: translocation/assembly module TamB domain-containing protein [Maribacter]|uniref:Translocation/assembly module TamB domain-containing protein n=1 Tax=Maribacter flavus TaxID=1658664 RepID=A0ABU7IDA8_9FLAO|nr:MULTISPECIES: translocation/assembly module TamB domain-containing protein [Maribacter]MDC6403702.1 translocation/assembly module TamB domain-containing protein [Maribacter sp. PR66]MEE1970843.1 translocation/assembly module TamB domain-containing protein [Maribacter flavus]